MNPIVRGFSRVFSGVRSIGWATKSLLGGGMMDVPVANSRFSRTLWQLCGNPRDVSVVCPAPTGVTFASNPCCGCNGVHTKGDKELLQFLAEEISAETKSQKSPRLPKIEGFDIKTDEASVTLTKKINDEMVTVTLNVNHTVDSEVPETDISPSQDNPPPAEMKSKPNFLVNIAKGKSVMSFGCSYVQEYPPEDQNDPDAFNDVFNIDELSIYEGEKKEAVYAVSGEVMDGYLYDLLMNLLEERGISNEFAEALIEFATAYEHKLYIKLLEGIKSFVSTN